MQPSPPVPGSAVEQELDLKEFLHLVHKHQRLLALVTLGGVLLALAYILLVPPTFEASVTVKVPDARGGNGVLKDLAVLTASSDPLETYVEVAHSTNVAIRAAAKAKLRQQPEYADARDDEEAVTAVKKKVDISMIKLSNLLIIKAQARDPRFAADLADAWAAAFTEANLDFSRTGARNKRQFIEEQLALVKQRLLQGEEVLRHLAEHQKSMGVGSRDADTHGSERDPIISLKTEVMNLEVERATLASRYNEDHPAMREIDAKLKEAQAQLDKGMASLPKNEMDYLRISRDVKVDVTLYSLLLAQGQEARIAESVDDSGIVVVDKAQLPRHRVAPRGLRILALSLFASLFTGLLLALIVERLRDQIGGEDDLKRLSGLPLLGLIPDWHAEGASLRTSSPPRQHPSYLINSTAFEHSFYAESFRSFRTNLRFTDMGTELKALSILSPSPEDGKTLVNSNLALVLALAGKKVCLVDADLRQPSIHKAFGLKVGPNKGLPLLLSGQASPASMLQTGPVAGLSLLPCGVRVPNPAELMGSQRLPRLIAWFKAHFDFVIFDAAPLLPVTDSMALAAHLDAVILLARFHQTRRLDFSRSLDQLAGVRARVLGTVLNDVDMEKYSYTYGHGYQRYGHSEKGPL